MAHGWAARRHRRHDGQPFGRVVNRETNDQEAPQRDLAERVGRTDRESLAQVVETDAERDQIRKPETFSSVAQRRTVTGGAACPRQGLEHDQADEQPQQDEADALERVRHRLGRLERFGESVGLPGPLVVPRTKDSQRSDRRHYREVLRDEDAEKIAKLFADEIALLDYEY